VADLPPPAEPQDLVSLVRTPGATRDLRLFAARGLLPLDRDDRMRALLAVLEDPDPDVCRPAEETLREISPDDLARFLDDADPTRDEIDVISRYSEDSLVLERLIRNRNAADETLLRLSRSVSGGPQEALIVNQVRLLRQPALIDGLLENPALTADGRRRLLELREEFFEKEERKRDQERLRREEDERRARQEAEGVVFEEAPPAGGADLSAPSDDADRAAAVLEDAQSSNLAAVYRRISVMTIREKISIAQKGTKEERRILIGDANMLVSLAVLSCEAISPAEIEAFSGMRHLHTEVFREIANSREWIKRPRIQLALVTNPAVPLTITLPLVKYLSLRDLRNVMRDRNLPEGVRATARKILFEKR